MSSMVKEGKSCSDVVEKHFNKKNLITKKDNEDFENSPKCWICDNNYVGDDVKVRDNCHITGKYKGSSHINVKC